MFLRMSRCIRSFTQYTIGKVHFIITIKNGGSLCFFYVLQIPCLSLYYQEDPEVERIFWQNVHKPRLTVSSILRAVTPGAYRYLSAWKPHNRIPPVLKLCIYVCVLGISVGV